MSSTFTGRTVSIGSILQAEQALANTLVEARNLPNQQIGPAE
jgi:hypothetical protein